MEEFDLNNDGKVSYEEFEMSMQRVKDKMDKKAEGAKEYTSYNKLILDKTTNKRMVSEL